MASEFLEEASLLVADLARCPASERRRVLDGLMDLRKAGKEEAVRAARRRLHQALGHLARYLLDAPRVRLAALAAAAAEDSDGARRRLVRSAAAEAVTTKRRLRALSRSFGTLHEAVLRTERPDRRLAQEYRDAAVENMRKRWNLAL